jgi:hypothetical protein
MGVFPRLDSLIVKSQMHFSPSDGSDVANVLQRFKDAGIYQLSLSVKLDDEAGTRSESKEKRNTRLFIRLLLHTHDALKMSMIIRNLQCRIMPAACRGESYARFPKAALSTPSVKGGV